MVSNIGTRSVRIDAVAKATGRGVYAPDMSLPGMLHAKLLGSIYPHARIVRIDTTQAQKIPGVRAIITGADFPKLGGRALLDRPVMARDKVRFIDEAVAAVAALDVATAEKAIEAIEVEYEELEPSFDFVDAHKETKVLIHEDFERYQIRQTFPGYPLTTLLSPMIGTNVADHFKLRRGDAAAGFAAADLVVEQTFSTQLFHHGYLEPHAAIADVSLDGDVVVWTNVQCPFRIHAFLADALGKPPEKVRLIAPYVGGAFGGKTDLFLEPIVSILSERTGRPVQLVQTTEETFSRNGGVQPAVTRIKSGVKSDGSILARQIEIFWDSGAYVDGSQIVHQLAAIVSCGPYKMPNVKVDSYLVYTNRCQDRPFRGLGCQQVNWAVEQHTDTIAQQLRRDPLKYRLQTIWEPGDVMHWGERVSRIHLKECLEKAAEAVDWQHRDQKAPNEGRGIAAMVKWTVPGTRDQAVCRLNPGGDITILTGAPEIGTGVHTVVAQIAAEVLKTPVDRVRIVAADTLGTPISDGASSSRLTLHAGNATKVAATAVREELLKLAAGRMEANAEDLDYEEGHVFVKGSPDRSLALGSLIGQSPLIKEGTYIAPGRIAFDADTGQVDRPAVDWHFGATAVHLRVDPVVGTVNVERIVGAHDVGKVINLNGVEGQIEGCLVQGTSIAMIEEMITDNGKLTNPTFMDYRMPTACECPEEVVPIIIEEPCPDGPFGAEGIGEPPVVAVGAAIGNALNDATGVRFTTLPLTPERVREGIIEGATRSGGQPDGQFRV